MFQSLPAQAQEFMYLSFTGRDLFAYFSGANAAAVSVDKFTTFLASFGIALTSDRAAYVFRQLDVNNDTLVSVPEYVQRHLASEVPALCRTTADAGTQAEAFPGCPCNPVANASVARCPAGVHLCQA
jgi:hypothetical protein